MKTLVHLLIFLFGSAPLAFSQLTLRDCQQKAKENYPLIRKYDLIKQLESYTLSNVAKAWLPQFQLNARATYQSEVTGLPITLPGIDLPQLKKEQYQATLEASQVLWDGGAIRAQQQWAIAQSETERQQVAVEMYALEERVNQLFFGILLFDEQLRQNRLLTDELQRNFTTVSRYIENGLANQADLDVVKVEQLNARQVRTQLQSTRKAFMEMLGIMTGEKWNETTVLEKPDSQPAGEGLTDRLAIHRPELQLFEAQNKLFDSQKALIQSAYMPKIGLFLQGGYGRPGLNMLSNEVEPFYIGGIRLNWSFGALYTRKNDLRKIELNQHLVDTQKDLFLYNLNLTSTRENREIQRLRDLIKDDDEIISLRENIRKATEAKVGNGTATTTDLMRELMHENLARQTKAAHEIDLLSAIYKLKNTMNNGYETIRK